MQQDVATSGGFIWTTVLFCIYPNHCFCLLIFYSILSFALFVAKLLLLLFAAAQLGVQALRDFSKADSTGARALPDFLPSSSSRAAFLLVIASGAKQSTVPAYSLDCHAAIAARNDGLGFLLVIASGIPPVIASGIPPVIARRSRSNPGCNYAKVDCFAFLQNARNDGLGGSRTHRA
ncbi:MAG: hypothetical protein LBC99_03105 [Spirochaetota bacterium]|nr:hypothetical protein [Spirochaetota bacterium]